MIQWHHQFNGHELGQSTGDGEGQGGWVCYSPWGCKELDMTWQLISNDMIFVFLFLTYFTLYNRF